MKRFLTILMLTCILVLGGSNAAWADTAVYTNHELGYQLNYPTDMTVDTSLGDACTILRDDTCQVEIYYQPVKNSSYASYVNYSNSGLRKNTVDHKNFYTAQTTINGKTAQVTTWNRDVLKQVKNDRNYYYTVDIRKNATEAYSIFIKSNRYIGQDSKYMYLINSFRTIQKNGGSNPTVFAEAPEDTQKRTAKLNMETRFVLNQYFGENAPLTWGIFEPTAPGDMSKLMKLENQMGQRFKFILYYHHLFGQTPIETVSRGLKDAYSNGYITELTLQTSTYNADNAMYDILNGEQDAYLNRYAREIAAFGHPVLLRFGNEMNGDWCIYSAYHTSKDTEIYKACYRYIHDIFEKNGATNVLWVWNPNEKSFPNFSWNAMEMYYPGNEYVDIIGLTGYNTGTYYSGETWRSFDSIYSAIYPKYDAMFTQPMMITEFGCSSIGGDKPMWIANMFRNITKFPGIKVAIWWNGCDWAVPGEVPARPYWVNETEATLNSFRDGWAAQTGVKLNIPSVTAETQVKNTAGAGMEEAAPEIYIETETHGNGEAK